MANSPLEEYNAPNINDLSISIKRTAITSNNFENKPATIQLFQNSEQFSEFTHEDPNDHFLSFKELHNTFHFNGVFEDAVRLRLFLFSLTNKAKTGLNSLTRGSINTWEELAKIFLSKFFPSQSPITLKIQYYSILSRRIRASH